MKTKPAPLGVELKSARKAQGLSRHAVAKPARISAAYLQKLEEGAVQNPNPRILHRLAGVLEVSYPGLMELAGYEMPAEQQAETRGAGTKKGKRGKPAPAWLALQREDLSEDEWRAVAAFVAHLKAQRQVG